MSVVNTSVSLVGQLTVGKLGRDLGPATPEWWGIYQTRPRAGGRIWVKEKFYVPTNPRTPAQQAWRDKYADSIVAWRALTSEQKEVYNVRARGKKMSGYNLFQKEFLLA